MALARVNYDPRLTRQLVAAGVLADDPFRLLDIGCSAGLDACWRQFEPSLVAAGADPLVEECERLAADEANPSVSYFARWVGLPEYRGGLMSEEAWLAQQDQSSPGNNQTYGRSSSVRAAALLAFDSNQHFSNGRSDITLAEERSTLDEFVRDLGWPAADFVKIDTDGGDYEVLAGGPETLTPGGLLGASIEVQLHGLDHEHANTFANIDRLMRAAGYTLFDLDTYRYSRAALPDRFTYNLIAQTGRGQVAFGEALYLWDACLPANEALRRSLPVTKLVKLACLFELFGLDDCAAELILAERDRLDPVFDTAGALDLLARRWWPRASGYGEVVGAFEADPRAFHADGSFGAGPPPVASPVASELPPVSAPVTVAEDLPPLPVTPSPSPSRGPSSVARAAASLDRWTEEWLTRPSRWP